MPVKLKKQQLKSKPAGKAPEPVKLSIEEVRSQFEFGTLERAVGELEELLARKNDCREATNAENRQKTQAGKAMKQMVADGNLDYGDQIQFGSFGFAFDYTHSDVIDPRKLYDLVVEKKLELDTFLKCISVQKDMASKLVGAHVIDKLLDGKTGNKADVRVIKLDKPVASVTIAKKPTPPKKRLLRDTDEKPVDNVINAVPLRKRRLIRASTR